MEENRDDQSNNQHKNTRHLSMQAAIMRRLPPAVCAILAEASALWVR